jgi:hypothetical protein
LFFGLCVPTLNSLCIGSVSCATGIGSTKSCDAAGGLLEMLELEAPPPVLE